MKALRDQAARSSCNAKSFPTLGQFGLGAASNAITDERDKAIHGFVQINGLCISAQSPTTSPRETVPKVTQKQACLRAKQQRVV